MREIIESSRSRFAGLYMLWISIFSWRLAGIKIWLHIGFENMLKSNLELGEDKALIRSRVTINFIAFNVPHSLLAGSIFRCSSRFYRKWSQGIWTQRCQ